MTVNSIPLKIELVPKSAWWTNVRSNVSRADWEKCKEYSKSKTDACCIICGQSSRKFGFNYDTEAHEIWAYEDDNYIQTLVDIVPLCVMCHRVKHWGRAEVALRFDQVQDLAIHVCETNNWSIQEFEKYLDVETKIWAMRSNVEWSLDVSKLEEILGKPVEVTDRGT